MWRYPWGDEVAGAVDLTLGDLIRIDNQADCAEAVRTFRPLSDAERSWLRGETPMNDDVMVRRRPGYRPHAGDLIIGLLAPELHPLTMLTVGDIAEAAEVSKATIDSCRYRGCLPEPQAARGRTPLWARPIVRHWLATRPGPGWRTDIYTGKSRPGTRRVAAVSSRTPELSARTA